MMGKINVSELATILVEKHGMDRREAQSFIAAMVEVIQEGIERDRQVKVKGLGTFKIVEVGARESVNVNTGERVVIESHSKLAFTPDASLKELVNKPFLQFETVVLNEGVNFDDMEAKPEEEPVVEEPAVEEPEEETAFVEEPPVVEESPVVEEPSDEEESPVVEEPSVEDESPVEEKESITPLAPLSQETPLTQEEPSEESPEEYSEEEEETEVESSSSRIQWLWIPIILLLCGLCFGIGYYVGQNQKRPQIADPNETASSHAQRVETPESPEIVISESSEANKPDEANEVKAEKPNESDAQKPAETNEPQQPVQQPSAEPESEYKKYEAMDDRVRLGAYHIIGLDHVVKVQQGETLYRISRRALGPGMECYVEVYNGISANTPLQVGQEIKIPKLKVKSAVRKKNNK